ncbi:MAG TPA: PLP-dependent aminotransferase family protein [Planctomycetaceae bacterium]|nr:PLP-dependent aminotransferase family protein [Planctomycetaceae bacterium]
MDRQPGFSNRAAWAAGQPISALMSQALAHPELISLAAGFVDPMTLPGELVQTALERLLASPEATRTALQYGTTPGVPRLRDLILQRLLSEDGNNSSSESLSIDQVVVTAGSNQLIHLVLESLLDPGDIVLCAAPTYLVFLGVVSQLGARAIGVSTDAEGMIPSALQEALEEIDRQGEKDRVKAIYLVPYADNPSGITMPLKRSSEIMEISRQWSSKPLPIQLIADLAYRDLRYSGDNIASIRTLDERGDQVILAGTFSKSFSPGVRVGWGLLPAHLVAPVCDQKGNIDFGSPNFNQYLMLDILEQGLLDSHLQEICGQYQVKLAAMLAASDRWFSDLEGVTWRAPSGGLYVWMEVPERIDTGPQGALFEAASREGVLYVAGGYCYAAEGEPIHRNTMRLSFGVQSPEKIEQGMKALSRALKSVMGNID